MQRKKTRKGKHSLRVLLQVRAVKCRGKKREKEKAFSQGSRGKMQRKKNKKRDKVFSQGSSNKTQEKNKKGREVFLLFLNKKTHNT